MADLRSGCEDIFQRSMLGSHVFWGRPYLIVFAENVNAKIDRRILVH